MKSSFSHAEASDIPNAPMYSFTYNFGMMKCIFSTANACWTHLIAGESHCFTLEQSKDRYSGKSLVFFK